MSTVGRRVLIVSPNFPPSSSPDMQRVRMSLPHFREFGWDPVVLTADVEPGAANDPLLSMTVPEDVRVERVRPLPASLMRLLGVGNIALRALTRLYSRGLSLLASERVDLVYFSTTMFFAVPLGRLWRARTGVPFVVDFQDPWLSDYYETHPEAEPPSKYALARRAHALLERWTMARASGIVAVSTDYIETLRRRYPRLSSVPALTLTFAASRHDFDLLRQHPQHQGFFPSHDACMHGAYVGRAGDDMRAALRILFDALAAGRTRWPEVFGRVRLHFIGTSYATDGRARQTVAPVAAEAGLADAVSETTARVPYFTALQVLTDAAFLIVLGSDDPAYTASKVYPYLFAGKPIVAVVHERSSLVPVLRAAPQTVVVTFGDQSEPTAAGALMQAWRELLDRVPAETPLDAASLAPYEAREMTRRQCELFDAVVAGRNC